MYTEDGHGRHGPVVRLCESIGPALHTWYIRCRQQVGPKVRLGPRMPARGLPSRAVARQFAGAAPPSELGMAPLTYLLLYVTPALMLHCMLTFHVRMSRVGQLVKGRRWKDKRGLGEGVLRDFHVNPIQSCPQ